MLPTMLRMKELGVPKAHLGVVPLSDEEPTKFARLSVARWLQLPFCLGI